MAKTVMKQLSLNCMSRHEYKINAHNMSGVRMANVMANYICPAMDSGRIRELLAFDKKMRKKHYARYGLLRMLP